MSDPIIDEIHKTREKLASRFNFDLEAIYEDLLNKQSNRKNKIDAPEKSPEVNHPAGKKVA